MSRKLAIALALVALAAAAAPAAAGVKGDVNNDCSVDIADVVLYQRYLQGNATLSSDQLWYADVAPLGVGDGIDDVGDLVVLQRAVAYDVVLPDNRPTIDFDPATQPSNGTISTNPISIDFAVPAPQGVAVTVQIAVNGHLQSPATATGYSNGAATGIHNLVALFDGWNTITATASIGGVAICSSPPLTVKYVNTDATRVLDGSLAQNRVLTPGLGDVDDPAYQPNVAYQVKFTDLTVAPAKTLVLQPGTTIEFHLNRKLVVSGSSPNNGGSLSVRGEPGNEVILTSGEDTPARGDWQGISILQYSDTSVIDHALIEYAKNGITSQGLTYETSLTVTNSRIRFFSSTGTGIKVSAQTSTPTLVVTDNIIDNRNNPDADPENPPPTKAMVSNDSHGVGLDCSTNYGTFQRNTIRGTRYGVAIANASPTVDEHVIELNYYGIRVSAPYAGPPAPTIRVHNLIRHNLRGIEVDGFAQPDPPRYVQAKPRINDNWIYDNFDFNYAAGVNPLTVPILDAQRNWWGTPDAAAIAAKIQDYTDVSTSPQVDFAPYYNDEALTELNHSYLLGFEDGSSTPDADTTYEALGLVFVASGVTWTIPQGAVLSMLPGRGIEVEGTLRVEGTAGDPVTFDSSSPVHCSDGVDNDGDGLVDYPNDPQCDSPEDVGEGPPPSEFQCSDSADNDGDGKTDYSADPDCYHQIDPTEAPIWSDYWTGIQVDDSSTGTTIDHASLVHATTAVTIQTASDVSITNSVLSYFRDVGVDVTGASGGMIDANTIDGGTTASERTATGIALLDSSPTITANTIQNAQVGIHVMGSSSPQIDGRNTITGNYWGLWIQGPGIEAASANPRPVIQDNNIFGNDGVFVPPPAHYTGYVYPYSIDPLYTEYLAGPGPHCLDEPANVCTSDFASADPVGLLDATGNWWGSVDVATVMQGFVSHPESVVAFDLDGFYDGSVTVGGPPGNPAPGSSPAYSVLVSEVERSADSFSPGSGEQVTISFRSVLAGTATLNIWTEKEADAADNPIARVLMRSISEPVLADTVNQILWDGRDDSGNLVPDEAYAYELLLDAGGGLSEDFDPPRIDNHFGAGGGQPGDLPVAYNTFENDLWKYQYQLVPHPLTETISTAPDEGFPSRVSLRVTPNGGTAFFPIDTVPMRSGETRWFIFDGRKPDGSLLTDDASFYFPVPKPMRPNVVFVDGTVPEVRGPASADPGDPTLIPDIVVKSNPFLVRQSYEQLTRIAFQLDQDANVTVQVLDPNGVVIATPLAGEPLSGGVVHSVLWTGAGTGAGESNGLLSTGDGVYTFTIRAENTTNAALFSQLRGVIQVRE